MKNKLIITLIAGVALSGCTTMRPIDGREASVTEQVEAGDHLVVYEKAGRIVDMTVREVDNDRITGTLTESAGATVEVDVDDIEKVEIEKLDGARTTLAVVGGTIVVVPLAILAVLTGGMMSGY